MADENQTTGAKDGHIEMPEEYVGRQADAATGQQGGSFWGDDEAGETIEMPDDPVRDSSAVGHPLTAEENPLLTRFIPDPWAEPTVPDSFPDPPAKDVGEVDLSGFGTERLAWEMEQAVATGEALERDKAFDALEDTSEDVGEAVADTVENIPFIGDPLSDVGDAFEDVVDQVDKPVVDPSAFVSDNTGEEPKPANAEQVELIRDVVWNKHTTQEEIEEIYKIPSDLYNEQMEEIYERQLADAFGDTAEDWGEAVTDSVKHLPFIGETLGGNLEGAGDFVEDVVDHMNDPVVDPWEVPPDDSFQHDPISGEPVYIDTETVKDMGETVLDSVNHLLPFVGEDEGAVDHMNDPIGEDIDPWG
jgi:hypothetical protein